MSRNELFLLLFFYLPKSYVEDNNETSKRINETLAMQHDHNNDVVLIRTLDVQIYLTPKNILVTKKQTKTKNNMVYLTNAT